MALFSVACVDLRVQGSLAETTSMIDGRKKRECQLVFELKRSRVSQEKANVSLIQQFIPKNANN